MSSFSLSIAPRNSLIGISDTKECDVPDVDPESNIAATESCILVTCLPEVDGLTEITLGPFHEVDPGGTPAFDGRLETPTGTVQISDVVWKPLLSVAGTVGKTRIRIWLSDPKFPDKVVVGVD